MWPTVRIYSAHTEVDAILSRCMNGSDVCDRFFENIKNCQFLNAQYIQTNLLLTLEDTHVGRYVGNLKIIDIAAINTRF